MLQALGSLANTPSTPAPPGFLKSVGDELPLRERMFFCLAMPLHPTAHPGVRTAAAERADFCVV